METTLATCKVMLGVRDKSQITSIDNLGKNNFTLHLNGKYMNSFAFVLY